ncbi:MAG: HD domain-containing protein [Bifidobacterium merycicum]|nr:HD domain-containing protein [Bifidobacterium merycicum]MBQ1513981.1 HD domain-containing protein [Bifidobacterium sp.]MEE1294869.1 HD domain-containing protein [Bifidobacterium merycicum]MEE3341652.1 HD domain-containing protein [Bifidobacterium merycicum]
MTGYIPTLEQVDELHHRIAPSDAAYDLIHRHCVIVARIARALARRQNALFTRRCSLPTDTMQMEDALPPSDGVIGGKVPPRLIDEHLVVIGGLLHDIGTYRVLKHDGTDGEPLQFNGPEYIKHGLLGYEYLIEQGVAEEIAQFARNHTGVGLTKEDVIRQGLPLPPDDYKPVNLEQELVMVADKYNSKSLPPKFLTADAYTVRAARFGEENKRRWLDLLDQYGVVDVEPMAAEYGMVLKR